MIQPHQHTEAIVLSSDENSDEPNDVQLTPVNDEEYDSGSVGDETVPRMDSHDSVPSRVRGSVVRSNFRQSSQNVLSA